MNKWGKSKKIPWKIPLILVILLTLSTLSIQKVNQMVEPQLRVVLKQQVTQALNQIATSVLRSIDYKNDQIIESTYDQNGNIVGIEYNSKAMNDILLQALETLHSSLSAAENGEKDPFLDRVLYQDGVIYKVPIGYFTGISFLLDKGFHIPIRMRILNQATGNIRIDSTPYGLNNTMVNIVLEVRIQAEAITTLSIEEIEVSMDIPIIVQIINGPVPNYIPYGGMNQESYP